MDPWACFLFTLWGLGCNHTIPPTPPPIITWETNGNPSLQPCSATVKKTCLNSYTLTQDGVVIAENIPPATLQFIVGVLPPSGTHTYALTINGADQAGKSISSKPATVPVKIP